jgi:signal transduction histidine kinase
VDDDRFARTVSLACHDLRTPLATIYGFGRTLQRGEGLDERTRRFLGLMVEASEQLTQLLDDLGTASRIRSGRWEPALADVDTLELARDGGPDGARLTVAGSGATVRTDGPAVARALRALSLAAIRFGPVDEVTWTVSGAVLELSPLTDASAPVVAGAEIRDFGALVAREVIETLGGSLAVDDRLLRVGLSTI